MESERWGETGPPCLGLVVHPSRSIETPLGQLRAWAEANDASLVQVPASCQQQRVAEMRDPGSCDLIVSIGGDGTTLAALRAGVPADRPVLAVACGSLGVLTSVPASGVVDALEAYFRGDWTPRSLPALDIARERGGELFALNDLAVVRDGAGQVRIAAELDGSIFAHVAGDGCIVSTPVGSSAYAMAAGGPLLDRALEAFAFTALPSHGGSVPPLVVGAESVIRLEVRTGMGGARLELDGQVSDRVTGALTISFRKGVATLVSLSGQEPVLDVLRDRRVIADSPRVLADEARE